MHRFTDSSMQNKLISIGKAAKLLGVSIDTLRRWDLAGRLQSTRSSPRGHRYYLQSDIDQYLQDVDVIAHNCAQAPQAIELKDRKSTRLNSSHSQISYA